MVKRTDDLLSIPELGESMPERDPLFMDYCKQVINCASRQASQGRDCENCPGRERCNLYFNRVSNLSGEGKLTPDRHQYYLKKFMQLINRAVL